MWGADAPSAPPGFAYDFDAYTLNTKKTCISCAIEVLMLIQ